MKRDMDTIRRIVLAVQAADNGTPTRSIEGIDAADFAAHAQLLTEAGLVTTTLHTNMDGVSDWAVIHRLTWAGQDFASAINDDTLWQKAKHDVMQPAASWTFGILLDYLKAEIGRNMPALHHLF